jgi:hypothetical protein
MTPTYSAMVRSCRLPWNASCRRTQRGELSDGGGQMIDLFHTVVQLPDEHSVGNSSFGVSKPAMQPSPLARLPVDSSSTTVTSSTRAMCTSAK